MKKDPIPEYKRLLQAMLFSLSGLSAAWKNEAAFRSELILSFLLIPIGIYLGRGPIEKALLILPIIFLLIIELLNSAIEACVDRSGTEFHLLAGRAKDLGSAAVFLAILAVPTVWGFILFDLLVD